MKHPLHRCPPLPHRHHQTGAVMVVVLVMMMLAALTALGTSRNQWLSERTVGSESDVQRAFAAAEAVLRDAELDIRGLRADGITPCGPDAAQIGCRSLTNGAPYFPYTLDDFEINAARVAASGRPCVSGICMPTDPGVMSIAYLKANTAALTDAAAGARYGQFTAATQGSAGNPLLSSANPRAWYWVEVYRFNQSGFLSSPAAGMPTPARNSPFLYRITVHVQGLRAGTRVWLRSTLVLQDFS